MPRGLLQADRHGGFTMALAQFQQPLPERLGRAVDGFRAALAAGGFDQGQVGLAIGAVQADDQVIGIWGVRHGSFLCVALSLRLRWISRRLDLATAI